MKQILKKIDINKLEESKKVESTVNSRTNFLGCAEGKFEVLENFDDMDLSEEFDV